MRDLRIQQDTCHDISCYFGEPHNPGELSRDEPEDEHDPVEKEGVHRAASAEPKNPLHSAHEVGGEDLPADRDPPIEYSLNNRVTNTIVRKLRIQRDYDPTGRADHDYGLFTIMWSAILWRLGYNYLEGGNDKIQIK